jgi:hypothetical protein
MRWRSLSALGEEVIDPMGGGDADLGAGSPGSAALEIDGYEHRGFSEYLEGMRRSLAALDVVAMACP